MSKTYIENDLTLKVAPANSAFIYDQTINIFSFDGRINATLVVIQEGDLSKIPEDMFENIAKETSLAMEYNYTAEAYYTRVVDSPANNTWREFYDNQISTNSNKNFTMWSSCYKAVGMLNNFINFDGLNDELKARFQALRAVIYYQMVMLWGNIVYMEKVDLTNLYQPQLTEEESLQKIRANLEQSKAYLTPTWSEDLGFLQISSHLADGIIAKILIREKKHRDALNLIDGIISSRMYSLSSSLQDTFVKNSSELVYSLPLYGNSFNEIYTFAEVLPVLSYTEVLLMAAECNLSLGNTSEALSIINLIEVYKEITPSLNVSLEQIELLWKNELAGSFSYFDFLKRNGLAEESLGISSYKTLFPIPSNEIMFNPNMMQNPGY